MSLLNEYIKKGIDINTLENELLNLIKRYNDLRKTYLFVYAAAINKRIPDIALQQEDHYIISDLLRNSSVQKLDFYIETPGGSGEAAEEIVRCLRSKSDDITFIVSGEAKSAGTLMVLSGDEIIMTRTGSLGPIDAQMKIGRSQISAMDYKEWIEDKQKEASITKNLNPVDATIIAQISPGELQGVYQSLKFAEDLVKEWLPKYKFKNWDVTETGKEKVTEEKKVERAKQIVEILTNRNQWHSHGRSIKIEDLEGLLKIIKADDDEELKDIIYRIQIVCKLIFDTSTNYKIFATADYKIFKSAAQIPSGILPPTKRMDVAQIDLICPQCSREHKIYLNLSKKKKIDEDMLKKGLKPYPKDNKFKCDCGYSIDLTGLKNQIEMQVGNNINQKEE